MNKEPKSTIFAYYCHDQDEAGTRMEWETKIGFVIIGAIAVAVTAGVWALIHFI